MSESQLYFSFIKGTLKQDSQRLPEWDTIDWNSFYAFAQQQAVMGVVFEGIERIKPNIPRELLLQWLALSEQIKQRNILMNRRAVEVTKVFAEAGFRSCVLKGQGNNLMYPNPYVRNSGDIDIWIDAKRKDITDFVKSRCPDAEDGERHIHFPVFKDVEVEVHYVPCSSNVPKFNKHLQAFFRTHAEEQFIHQVRLPDVEGNVCVPTHKFNVIYQLAHIMSHFFTEGIGLRQFIDYYYVLRHTESIKSTEKRALLNTFGMLKFAKGVMWIEKECLGLEERYLIAEPDEKVGKLILQEMLEGGNFGHHDQRYSFRKRGYLARGATDVFRLLKLSPMFPTATFWTIIGKAKNQKWKITQ